MALSQNTPLELKAMFRQFFGRDPSEQELAPYLAQPTDNAAITAMGIDGNDALAGRPSPLTPSRQPQNNQPLAKEIFRGIAGQAAPYDAFNVDTHPDEMNRIIGSIQDYAYKRYQDTGVEPGFDEVQQFASTLLPKTPLHKRLSDFQPYAGLITIDNFKLDATGDNSLQEAQADAQKFAYEEYARTGQEPSKDEVIKRVYDKYEADFKPEFTQVYTEINKQDKIGGGGLSAEEKLQIANDLLKQGITDKADIVQALETTTSQKTYDKIQEQIDQATNPTKYQTPEQTGANKETAQRLVKQTYGEEYNDPDLEEFISSRMAEGESAFELSQFLKTTPEYMKREADVENKRVTQESAAAREALNTELLKSEEEAFARAQPSIISQYMKAGRLNSSGLNNALAQARGDLARERQGYIAQQGFAQQAQQAGYSRENFVNQQAGAFNQYLRQNEPSYQQRFNLQNASNFNRFQVPYQQLGRQQSLNDRTRERQYEIEDYYKQQADYNKAQSEARKFGRQNALYGLLGAGIGGITGAFGRKAFGG